jgi:hypothetical protein
MSEVSVCHILHVIDGKTEETVDVIELTAFDLAAFRLQFDVPDQLDPDMLDRYTVGPDDVSFLVRYLSVSLTFDFTNRGYWIEAVRKD